MKFIFEVVEFPKDPDFPISYQQILDNGSKKGPFYMQIDDLIGALQAKPESFNSDCRENEVSTPVLPFGTIRYSNDKVMNNQRLAMEIPKTELDIQYNGEFYKIGFPRMVLTCLVRPTNRKTFSVTDTHIFAVLDNRQPITDTTELYQFPYPNVYRSGNICWGGNTRLEVEQIHELSRLFQMFVSAPFGEDLGVKTTLGIPNFAKLLEEIKEKSFNDDWLLPANDLFKDVY